MTDHQTNKWAMLENDVVENIVLWDGDTNTWAPPDEYTMVLLEDAARVQIGDVYQNGEFSTPVDYQAILHAKLLEVDSLRDANISKGVTVIIDTTSIPVQTRHAEDFRNINGLVSMAMTMQMSETPTTFPFRDAEDVTHNLTAEQVISLGAQTLMHVQAMYQVAWNHKDALNNLPLEDVVTYDVTEGWS